MISAEDLRTATDVLASMRDEDMIAAFGLPVAEIVAFLGESEWREIGPAGPLRDLDALALATGISIGVIAAARPGAVPRESIEERPQ